MVSDSDRYLSIREIVKTGLIREYTLRILVKQGKVPCIYSGTKCLINYKKLLEVLNEMGETNTKK